MTSFTTRRFPPLIAWAAVIFTAWNSSQLLTSWKNSPAEISAKLCFLLWLLPIIYYWTVGSEKHLSKNYWTALLTIGMLTSLAGAMIHLNFLTYIGLVLCVAAFLPFYGIATFIWLASSVLWMPAMSWLLAKYAPNFGAFGYYSLRIGLSVIAATIICIAIKRFKQVN